MRERESRESRVIEAAELRAEPREAGGPPMIVGYAAVYDSLSEDLGGFREQIAPGAFARTLRTADVRALVDHDPSKILGRSTAGTLRLRNNAKGLLAEVDPPDTQAGRDIVASIQRGDVSGMSFTFRVAPNGDSWEMLPNGQGAIRTLRDVDLLDVSVVTFPAYPETEVAVRALEALRATVSPTAPASEPRAEGLLTRMRMRLDLAERD
jgi:uncharacterized protein